MLRPLAVCMVGGVFLAVAGCGAGIDQSSDVPDSIGVKKSDGNPAKTDAAPRASAKKGGAGGGGGQGNPFDGGQGQGQGQGGGQYGGGGAGAAFAGAGQGQQKSSGSYGGAEQAAGNPFGQQQQRRGKAKDDEEESELPPDDAAEEAVNKFLDALDHEEYTQLEQVISARASHPMLKRLRGGKSDEAQEALERLRDDYARSGQSVVLKVMPSPNKLERRVSIGIPASSGKADQGSPLANVEVRQEGKAWRIITIRPVSGA